MTRDELFAEMQRRGWQHDGKAAALVHIFVRGELSTVVVEPGDGVRWVLALHVVGCEHDDGEVRQSIDEVEGIEVEDLAP